MVPMETKRNVGHSDKKKKTIRVSDQVKKRMSEDRSGCDEDRVEEDPNELMKQSVSIGSIRVAKEGSVRVYRIAE